MYVTMHALFYCTMQNIGGVVGEIKGVLQNGCVTNVGVLQITMTCKGRA